MTGLLVGVFTPEKQISSLANPDNTSATPATTVRTENSEGGKSGRE